jgi:hypothetical protein
VEAGLEPIAGPWLPADRPWRPLETPNRRQMLVRG